MRIAGKSILEMVAQEWYVLTAYVGTFILLEIRRYGEQIAMHRVARHGLWAASVVVVLHSIVAAAAMIRRSGLDFAIIDYALVMTLTISLVYLLGCMFEEAPEPAFARSSRRRTHCRGNSRKFLRHSWRGLRAENARPA